jgi:uncharacterized OsmC-like protein
MGSSSSEVSQTQSYEATGTVRSGGEGRLMAHGLATAFDGTAGRLDDLPGPADVLCAALSACLLKNVERFSHLLSFHYESATVQVTAEREERPPRIVRIHYSLRVLTNETPERVALLHRNIRAHGTITNTLAAACELQGEIEVSPPSAGAPTVFQPLPR